MNDAPKSEAKEAKKGNRPPKKPSIIRILHTLVRHHNARRRTDKGGHQSNEWMMARWTRNVGLFTLALVVVGIVTAVIFKRQLDAMQGQLKEMQAASIQADKTITAFEQLADAAQQTAVATKEYARLSGETAERQLRAYVVAEFDGNDSVDEGNLNVQIMLRNAGGTPARNLRVFGYCGVEKVPLPGNLVNKFAYTKEGTVLLPYADVGVKVCGELDDAELKLMERDDYVLLACVKAEYADVFGKNRQTMMCGAALAQDVARRLLRGARGSVKINWLRAGDSAD
jgi:hypothetical protein